MTCAGTRNERARMSLRNIGPAVLNGGLSTFLAFIPLVNSKSHVFLTFFKVITNFLLGSRVGKLIELILDRFSF